MVVALRMLTVRGNNDALSSEISLVPWERSSEEKLQQVGCYRAGDEPGGLDMEEKQRGEERIEACLPNLLPYLLVWQACLMCSS